MTYQLDKINEVIQSIDEYEIGNPHHKISCDFLRKEYLDLKKSIELNALDKLTQIQWSTWFAPRIVYESINDKNVLQKIERTKPLVEDFRYDKNNLRNQIPRNHANLLWRKADNGIR